MSALTTIYVDNVVSHLPENSRGDIAAEIRATIDDMVEARLGGLDHPADEQTAAAERDVLEELGDPVRLSREYSNSPQHLIGPNTYPLFLWAMRWVIPLVAVISVTANAIAFIATQATVQIGALIGQLVGNTVTALLVAFAAVTIILALGDRGLSGGAGEKISGTRKTWSVDQLRATDAKAKQIRAEAVLNLIFLVLLALIPLIPTSLVYVGHLNNGETFINPDLESGWLLGYWAFLTLMAVIEVIKLVRSSTSAALIITGVVLDVAMAVFLTIALLTQQVLHPDLTSASGAEVQQIITVIAIWAIVIWDQISTWRAHRANR
ncbi:HAAS signaling domain-containing protein [Brevibacterium aurantiacum]|uniref:HAAS signaling domain-containing protein n=1 Tax=Brevibacterium aurantiacum TaxID=273384 RepID=UPI000DF3CE56|nr:hypothetical protein [Brevibacterium aurantiacum]RCS89929.1 hypothetical protein CIK63_07825 [Brevibacterium aurantiacum]